MLKIHYCNSDTTIIEGRVALYYKLGTSNKLVYLNTIDKVKEEIDVGEITGTFELLTKRQLMKFIAECENLLDCEDIVTGYIDCDLNLNLVDKDETAYLDIDVTLDPLSYYKLPVYKNITVEVDATNNYTIANSLRKLADEINNGDKVFNFNVDNTLSKVIDDTEYSVEHTLDEFREFTKDNGYTYHLGNSEVSITEILKHNGIFTVMCDGIKVGHINVYLKDSVIEISSYDLGFNFNL